MAIDRSQYSRTCTHTHSNHHQQQQEAMSSTGQMRGLNKGYPVQKLEAPKRPAGRKGVSGVLAARMNAVMGWAGLGWAGLGCV